MIYTSRVNLSTKKPSLPVSLFHIFCPVLLSTTSSIVSSYLTGSVFQNFFMLTDRSKTKHGAVSAIALTSHVGTTRTKAAAKKESCTKLFIFISTSIENYSGLMPHNRIVWMPTTVQSSLLKQLNLINERQQIDLSKPNSWAE